MLSKKFNYVKGWFIGFLAATAIMWVLGIFFISPVPDWEKCHKLGIYVRKPGTIHRHNQEGWGKSVYGKYDIIGIEDVEMIESPKILVWGDSFVEGYQLPDSEKLPQQITETWFGRNNTKLTGVGVGVSGRSLVDYYNLMPAYEKVVKPIAHVVVMASFEDISPDGVRFIEKPSFKFTDYNDSKRFIKIRHLLSAISLNFFYSKIENWVSEGIDLRFSLGTVKLTGLNKDPISVDEEIPIDAWKFALDKLRERTDLPIFIVYTPPAPEIFEGDLILEDRYSISGQSRKLSELCSENEIGYIDMKLRNISFFNQTGKFPRGFNNGGFATGHCNRYGHQLMSEAICDYVEENIDGIHAD